MKGASRVEACGVELCLHDAPGGDGAGSAVICLHETGETAASFSPLASALAGRSRVIAYDRRGWGGSGSPEPYTRTTIAEQGRDAVGVLDALAVGSASFCGSGLGALAALDAAFREPGRVDAVIAIEPPLLFLLPEINEEMSADVAAMTAAAETGGVRAAAELHASGGLAALGPGAERTRSRSGADGSPPAVSSPLSLLAEIAAVPAWSTTTSDLSRIEAPVALVTGEDSPAVIRRAVDAAVDRMPRMRRVELDGDPLLDPALADLLVQPTG